MKISEPASRRQFLTRSALAVASLPAMSYAASEEVSVSREIPQTNFAKPDQPPPHVTRIIAEWMVQSRFEDIPIAVRKEAIRSVVNWIGVTIGGSAQEAASLVIEVLIPYSGSGKSSLFGRSEKLDPLRAALINGISSHVLDYDDTHLPTIIHPAGPVAAALFALSEEHPISGAEFLHAFILGTEIECRLGKAIYPSHYEMGWHISGTCGVFGVAAACGKILGLNAEKMVWALGIAATQAAGLKIMFGTMCKSLNVGRAAENGLLAAFLAERGFTSSEQSIEGKEGYIDAASREHDYDQLTNGLGDHYEISLNTYKPYACGIVIHPAIDGILQISKEDHVQATDVQTITIHGNPLVLQLTGKLDPETGLEGKFSIYHAVAVALVRGYAGTQEFSDEAVHDPLIIALRQRVKVSTDPSIRSDEAFVTVVTRDGHTFEKHIEHAAGSLQNPLSNHDLEVKFRKLIEGIVPEPQISGLLSTAWGIESLPDAGELPRRAAVSAKRSQSQS
jgi:2-methylcitrate dehydratase PrpD